MPPAAVRPIVGLAPRRCLLPQSLGFLAPIVVDGLQRFGSNGDGGYVLPAWALKAIDAVVSFGISENFTFEEALAAVLPGVPIHGYDPTVSDRHFRKRVTRILAKFLRLRASGAELADKYRSLAAYRRVFAAPSRHFRERIFNRSDGPGDATIDQVFARIPGRDHVLLKMDIEGAEYRVIPDILRYAGRIDILAIEFHDTDPLRAVFLAAIEQLLAEFRIVHLHGNNVSGVAADGLPEALEITFLAKRLVPPGLARRQELPLEGLDFPNYPAAAELALVFAPRENEHASQPTRR
jgi:hypothetical protein